MRKSPNFFTADAAASIGKICFSSNRNNLRLSHNSIKLLHSNPCDWGSRESSNFVIQFDASNPGYSDDQIARGEWNQKLRAYSQSLKILNLVGRDLLKILHTQFMNLGWALTFHSYLHFGSPSLAVFELLF
ncbi:hypothetical protein PIB30_093398 [Stylosanthes scabra]|uniref:Uncharacterized protein n=1 Tax=Stylosanthes scabra TaxID=79078 RepID=A0ABU6QVQ6_9FABA|nr:hypothetical protein [Stylosanthes scabra]